MPDVALTWLGHAAFRFDTPGGKRVYVDPFLQGNPKCPEPEQSPERVDLILVTHGHDDHVGDTVELAQRFECPVVALVECRGWLAGQGCRQDSTQHAGNKGGTLEVEGLKVTFTDANHSSSTFEDGKPVYLGEPRRLRGRGRERDEALLRRRHERLREHAAHRRASTSRTSRSSRSATTTRWGRARRRWRSSSSA